MKDDKGEPAFLATTSSQYAEMVKHMIAGSGAIHLDGKVMSLQDLMDAGYKVVMTKNSFKASRKRGRK